MAFRSRPYTETGLRRVHCVHCRERRATFQWSLAVCANDRRKIHVPVCIECDIEFNRASLAFIHHPDIDAMMARYAEWAKAQS